MTRNPTHIISAEVRLLFRFRFDERAASEWVWVLSFQGDKPYLEQNEESEMVVGGRDEMGWGSLGGGGWVGHEEADGRG